MNKHYNTVYYYLLLLRWLVGIISLLFELVDACATSYIKAPAFKITGLYMYQ
jgi:hypothetical protein